AFDEHVTASEERREQIGDRLVLAKDARCYGFANALDERRAFFDAEGHYRGIKGGRDSSRSIVSSAAATSGSWRAGTGRSRALPTRSAAFDADGDSEAAAARNAGSVSRARDCPRERRRKPASNRAVAVRVAFTLAYAWASASAG